MIEYKTTSFVERGPDGSLLIRIPACHVARVDHDTYPVDTRVEITVTVEHAPRHRPAPVVWGMQR